MDARARKLLACELCSRSGNEMPCCNDRAKPLRKWQQMRRTNVSSHASTPVLPRVDALMRRYEDLQAVISDFAVRQQGQYLANREEIERMTMPATYNSIGARRRHDPDAFRRMLESVLPSVKRVAHLITLAQNMDMSEEYMGNALSGYLYGPRGLWNLSTLVMRYCYPKDDDDMTELAEIIRKEADRLDAGYHRFAEQDWCTRVRALVTHVESWIATTPGWKFDIEDAITDELRTECMALGVCPRSVLAESVSRLGHRANVYTGLPSHQGGREAQFSRRFTRRELQDCVPGLISVPAGLRPHAVTMTGRVVRIIDEKGIAGMCHEEKVEVEDVQSFEDVLVVEWDPIYSLDKTSGVIELCTMVLLNGLNFSTLVDGVTRTKMLSTHQTGPGTAKAWAEWLSSLSLRDQRIFSSVYSARTVSILIETMGDTEQLRTAFVERIIGASPLGEKNAPIPDWCRSEVKEIILAVREERTVAGVLLLYSGNSPLGRRLVPTMATPWRKMSQSEEEESLHVIT